MSLSSVFVCLNSLRLRNFKANFENDKKIKKENKMKELNKMIVKVNNMSCNHCKNRVEETLKSIAGIENAEVNLDEKLANVEYFGSIDEKEIEEKINDAGYEFVGIEYK